MPIKQSRDTNLYYQNPLIHKDRKLSSASSEWVRSFSCGDMRPLIICRGPIRKEAMDVFTEMGIEYFGILLSEKDSITYPNALSPELRLINDVSRIHRVPDYTGANKEERLARISQIISIAQKNNYNAIFAGYGFMAEDEEMVAAMERAGLNFIGPCSQTVHSAGLKDEAKRTALKVGVSVTPGVDNATALALLAKYPDIPSLKSLVNEKQLNLSLDVLDDESVSLEDKADKVLAAAYEKGIDLYTVAELQAQIEKAVAGMYAQYPNNRIRLKAIGGGGGKGQRILPAPSAYQGSQQDQVKAAAAKAPELVMEILNEVKATGVGDNKNVLVELNIETTRHQEIQVVGNGDWCITMGARDCSLQMHEQKLLEVSSTIESIQASIQAEEAAFANGRGSQAALETLRQDLVTLEKMEQEASTFGAAVGLDSVSTFECIVDRDAHFFMEMNTRIQVEHRVTELCYELEFINEVNAEDRFIVDSLVELMVLLARHGKRLPKPRRIVRKNASVEARLNATNAALQPHAGGVINYWSEPCEDEIRDDQGICIHNPDTDVFIKYKLAGAYDSNIALILTHGADRLESYECLSEIIRTTEISGEDLCTNLEFHYGLVNWFIGNHIQARPTTKFIVPYLTAVGLLKQAASSIDLGYLFNKVKSREAEQSEHKAVISELISRKQSLLLRPIQIIFDKPHILSGWLSVHKKAFTTTESGIEWQINPLELLEDLYHFLAMDFDQGKFAQRIIWDHDHKILEDGLAFYHTLKEMFSVDSFLELHDILSQQKPPQNIEESNWDAIKAAHAGHQAGLDILKLLPYIAYQTNFYQLKVAEDLSITIPDKLLDEKLQEDMQHVLVPPPVAKSDEIIAVSGGMYYPREAPGTDVYVKEGDHFEVGDVLYIVEVMKMFNKVTAPFAGTVEKCLIDGDGVIISKGDALFKVKPDVEIKVESEQEKKERLKNGSDIFLSNLYQ